MSVTVPSQALIGGTVDFTVDFSNASPTQTGFGPYIDLELPSVGADGNNGVTFKSAGYLGVGLAASVLTFDGSGHANHPYAKTSAGLPVVVNGTPGDQLVVLALPFGSVTPGQPAARVSVSADLSSYARLGTSLNISATGGFRYGDDALDNPAADPSLRGASISGNVDPSLILVKTTYLGPENETATGPNYRRQYLVTATVAPGQTIRNLDLKDQLPPSLRFVSVDSASANGATQVTTKVVPSTTTPGGLLVEEFDKVVGTGGANDVSMQFTFDVPRDDSVGNAVLNLGTGAYADSINQASAVGDWTSVNPAFGTLSVTSNTAAHTLHDKSIAVQKRVVDLTNSGAPRPGDVLEYTISFQLSDYFAFQNLITTDVLSDGQHFDESFAPTLSFTQHGTDLASIGMLQGNVTVGAQNTGDGTTTVSFNVSGEIEARGITGGRILGGAIPNGGTGGPIPASAPSFGATTGTITFRTIIQQRFDYRFPSGEAFVDQGDVLSNDVSTTADLLAYANLNLAGVSRTDTSTASVTIPRGSLVQSIYAVNGVAAGSGSPKIAASDTVTYRLQFSVPHSNIENLDLSAYLPLPVLAAAEVTHFDDLSSATAPASGHAQFGPADTYRAVSGIVPTLGTDTLENSLTFGFGTFHDPLQQSATVDLLFTVTASHDPFADGLYLTTQAHESEGSTNNGNASADAIVMVQLTEPVLTMTKGVVATDNAAGSLSNAPYSFTAPGSSGTRFSGTINSGMLTANPINAGLTGVDAGDLVTFAIAIQNTGTGLHGAYDITIRDLLPSGFRVPSGGINLKVTDGTGASLSYVDVGAGTGLLDQGIRIVDGGNGALSAYDPTAGTNVLIVTYDLQLADSVSAKQTLTNTASLTNYASVSGGPDFLTTPLVASAGVTIAGATLSKSIIATDQGFTTGTKLAIGEIATYQVSINVPEGVIPSAKLIDTLPSGLAIVGINSITASTAQVTTSRGTWADVLASFTTIGSLGSSATLDFGTITNSNSDNATSESITIQYQVIALNAAINANNAVVRNNASFTYTGGSASASASATIVTPQLRLTMSGSRSSGQAGDIVTFSVTLTNVVSNGSGTNAYDVNLTDLMPTGIAYVPGSLSYVAGLFPSLNDSSGSPVVNYSSFPLGNSSIIAFQGVIQSSTGPYQSFVNTAKTVYSTLPGDIRTAKSSHAANSTERTGDSSDPGGSANNLVLTKSVTVTTSPPTLTKTILGTGLAATAGANVAIGETVQYRISLAVPDGLLTNALLTDSLPAGMALVGIDSWNVVGLLATSQVGGFQSVFDNATIGTNGSSFRLDFGTLTNSDLSSSTEETITVDLTAVVLNAAADIAGTQLVNQATFSVQGGSATISAPALTVVTPKLTLSDSASATTAQAGDTVSYTLTIKNSAADGSGQDAYDVVLTDLIASGMSYVAGSFRTISGTTPTSVDETGGRPRAVFSTLALGSTTVIVFEAKLLSSIGPYQTLSDHANLSYTTLPGDVTTPVSSYNSVSTERTGDTANPGGSLNSLLVSAAAPVATAAPNLSKSIIGSNLAQTSGPNGAIGEIFHYRITMTIPDGVGSNAILSDALPSGLSFIGFDGWTVDGSISTSRADGFTGAFNGVTIVSGASSFSVDLGTLVNSDLDSSKSEQIVVEYSAVVLNVASNTAGHVLQNFARLDLDGGHEEAYSPNIMVAEPELSLSISPSTPNGDAGGDVITFTLRLNAIGATATDAFDVVLGSVIPVEYTYVTGTFVNTGGVVPDSLSDASAILVANFAHLSPGQLSTFTFEAYLSPNSRPGVSAGLSATTTWSSLPGSASEPMTPLNEFSVERTGSTSDPGGAANQYLVSASTEVAPISNTIDGTLFVDGNKNGGFDEGERTIPGVTITLTGVDNLAFPVELTTVTDVDGHYHFAALRPGTYKIESSGKPGYLSVVAAAGAPFSVGSIGARTIDSLEVGTGGNDPGTGYDFVVSPPSTISGLVYIDSNNDGMFGPGEDGIPSVEIDLVGLDRLGNPVSRSTHTDASGSFIFEDLLDGAYSISEVQPNGYLQGTNSAGIGSGTLIGDVIGSISLGQGDNRGGIAFAELMPAAISGSVYLDLNNDGRIQTDESLLDGVSVRLSGTDDHGILVSVSSVTTGGHYEFGGLRPGTYTVSEETVNDYLDGRATPGTIGGGYSSSLDVIVGIGLVSGLISAENNFGVLPPASLRGMVYIDSNTDGRWSVGEGLASGVTVALSGVDDLGGVVSLTSTTDVNGDYLFDRLRPGTYRLAATVPDGLLAGMAWAGSLGGVTTVLDQVDAIVVQAGNEGTGNEHGSVEPVVIAGAVYHDANADGLRGIDETGVTLVSIVLNGIDDLGQFVVASAITGADGGYRFDGLRPGVYQLTEISPNTAFDGAVEVGSFGGLVAGRTVTAIGVGAGGDAIGYDFAVLIPSSLSGTVFDDRDNDGIPGLDEPRLSGIRVALIGTDDLGRSVSLVMTTDVTGGYAFSGLRPGTYTIFEEDSPMGFLDGIVTAGSSAGTVLGRSVVGIDIVGAADGTGYDFAHLRPSSIDGFIYDDLNNDAVFGNADSPLNDAEVRLSGIDDLGRVVMVSALADGDGRFAFLGLRPGRYSLSLVPIDGLLPGSITAGTGGGASGEAQISGILLRPEATSSDNFFGLVEPVGLSGRVYLDPGRTGVPEGAAGLGGVAIRLTGIDDRSTVIDMTMMTDASGGFSFSGLRPGRYALAKGIVVAYSDGAIRTGSSGGSIVERGIDDISLSPGVIDEGSAFGEVPATITGIVFVDLGGDGSIDPEDPVVPNAIVTAYDAENQVVATTTSDEHGYYEFRGFVAGRFALKATAATPEGPTVVMSREVVLPAGDEVPSLFPLNVDNGVVTGLVFSDTNNNGLMDDAERPVPGVTVTLRGETRAGGPLVLTTVTDVDGRYRFDHLRVATYSVGDDVPSRFFEGKGGSLVTDVTTNHVNDTIVRSLALLPKASISGFVFLDVNRNDRMNSNEFGMAHVIVSLTGVDDLGHLVSASAETNDDGAYLFSDLRPGTYSLSRADTPVFARGSMMLGDLGGLKEARRMTAITLAPGRTAVDYDFSARLRPGCLLETQPYYSLLLQGPRPAVSSRPLAGKPLPTISHWLPKFAQRLWNSSETVKGPVRHRPTPHHAARTIRTSK